MTAPTMPLPLHLGGLHPFEQALVLTLAFGPFVVLAVVIYIVRKRDAEDADETADQTSGGDELSG